MSRLTTIALDVERLMEWACLHGLTPHDINELLLMADASSPPGRPAQLVDSDAGAPSSST